MIRSRDITIVSVFASLYVVLGYVFHSISFLEFQVRIADALYPLIAVYGLPALIGTTLGHFLLNLTSPLGLIDLVSVIIFIPAKIAIWKFGLKGVILHVISVALWISFLLCNVLGIPTETYWILVINIGLGESLAEIGLGVPLTLAIRRRTSK